MMYTCEVSLLVRWTTIIIIVLMVLFMFGSALLLGPLLTILTIV